MPELDDDEIEIDVSEADPNYDPATDHEHDDVGTNESGECEPYDWGAQGQQEDDDAYAEHCEERARAESEDDAEHDARYLPDDFWNARPYLKCIYEVSLRQSANPDAVLRSVLARVAAYGSPLYVLPPIIGGEAALNYFTAIVGRPGEGKGGPDAIARQLVREPESQPCEHRSIGSGQGLVAGYFGKNNDKPPKMVRTHLKVFIYTPEGGVLGKLTGQPDSVLLETICSTWMGESCGQGGAQELTTRHLDRLSYRLGMVLTFQPHVAGSLLRENEQGAPQRFTWSMARPLTLPDDDDDIDAPRIQPLSFSEGESWSLHGMHKHIGVPDWIAKAVRKAVNDKRRMTDAEHDALPIGHEHEGLMRLKEAALLAILDNRHAINNEDWHLAKTMADASRAACEWARARVSEAEEEKEAHQQAKAIRARNAQKASDAEWGGDVNRCVQRLKRAIRDANGALKWGSRTGYLHKVNSRDRSAMKAAVPLLTAAGYVEHTVGGVEYLFSPECADKLRAARTKNSEADDE